MYDVIIVGGGAAALSAASYALSKKLNMLMIYDKLGGKAGQNFTVHTEQDYLVGHILVHLALAEQAPVGEAQFAGKETVQLFERQIKARSGIVMNDRVTTIKRSGDMFLVETGNNGIHQSAAVIVATGVKPRSLDVPGAREYLGMGLGYSPTTVAPQLAGKKAAVLGTSLRGLRGAGELARSAEKVYLVAVDQTNLITPLVNLLRQQPNVEVLEGYTVKEVRGDDTINDVVLERHGQERVLDVDAAFVDLGLTPNSDMVRNLVQLNQDGFIWVDDRNATTEPGMFAAGDVTTSFGEQVLIAIGDGARAALGAYDYILSRPLAYEPHGRD
jgi:thioredoxin reductase